MAVLSSSWLSRARAILLGGVALVAVAWGAATPVGRVVLLVAVVGFGLLLTVGYALQRRLDRRFPPVRFLPRDPGAAEELIDAARAALAAGDSVAFSIAPIVGDIVDADGQIWLHGAGDRTTLELALPDDVEAPEQHPAVAALLRRDWHLQEVRPGEWVILTRPGLVAAGGLATLVADVLADLFDLPSETLWECRRLS